MIAWYRLVRLSWGNNPLGHPRSHHSYGDALIACPPPCSSLGHCEWCTGDAGRWGPSCAGWDGVGLLGGVHISPEDVADYLQSALMMEFMPPNEGAAVAKILKMAGFTLRSCWWNWVDMFCWCGLLSERSIYNVYNVGKMMQFCVLVRWANLILEIQELHAMNIECHQLSFLTNSGEWKTVLTLDLNRKIDVLWSASTIFLWLRVGSVQIYHSNIDELSSFLQKKHISFMEQINVSGKVTLFWWCFSIIRSKMERLAEASGMTIEAASPANGHSILRIGTAQCRVELPSEIALIPATWIKVEGNWATRLVFCSSESCFPRSARMNRSICFKAQWKECTRKAILHPSFCKIWWHRIISSPYLGFQTLYQNDIVMS